MTVLSLMGGLCAFLGYLAGAWGCAEWFRARFYAMAGGACVVLGFLWPMAWPIGGAVRVLDRWIAPPSGVEEPHA